METGQIDLQIDGVIAKLEAELGAKSVRIAMLNQLIEQQAARIKELEADKE